MKCEEAAKIVGVRRAGEYVLLSLFSPSIAREARVGQFVNIRVTEGLDPLLRRPVSISDVDGEIVRLLVQVRGKGTAQLAQKREGETLSLLGPLGNGFPSIEGELLLVGGGVGVAPFAWVQRLYPKAILIVGARSASLLPPMDWFDASRTEVMTDDGSRGDRGTVLQALEKRNMKGISILACGPHRMLVALAAFLEANYPENEAYFSTESMMACGFGACKGCVLPKKNGEYALCCTDGPVFEWREMQWEE